MSASFRSDIVVVVVVVVVVEEEEEEETGEAISGGVRKIIVSGRSADLMSFMTFLNDMARVETEFTWITWECMGTALAIDPVFTIRS